jgi:hypothetical protein
MGFSVKENADMPKPLHLSHDEQALITLFRKLSDLDQQEILKQTAMWVKLYARHTKVAAR